MTENEGSYETITDGWGRSIRLPSVKHRAASETHKRPATAAPIPLPEPVVDRAPKYRPKPERRVRRDIVIAECPRCRKRYMLGDLAVPDPRQFTADQVLLHPCANHRKTVA